MPLPERGKVYVPQTIGEVRDLYLEDLRLGMIQAGILNPAVQPGTDDYIKADALASMMLGGYANIEIHARNSDEREAEGDELDAIREALGLPEVPASPSTGNLIVTVTGGGTVTIPDKLQFQLPNGLRGEVAGAHLGVANQGEVGVITVDTGSATEAVGGTKVRFLSPPPNVSETAYVSFQIPLTGGLDEETDARKRERIRIVRQERPAGGNWSHKVETALNSSSAVQAAFSYPALGGPGSERLVVTKSINPDFKDFSRVLSAAAVTKVKDAIQSEFGSPSEIVVSSVTEVNSDIVLLLTLPDAASAGGNGQGWLDQTPWPIWAAGDLNVGIKVTTVTTSSQITISAATTTAPVANQTRIAWWNPYDQEFEIRTITAQSGGTGAWVLTLDAPLVSSNGTIVAVNDFMATPATHLTKYGNSWRTIMNGLGPGECTADAFRLPRALRHPFSSESWPANLGVTAGIQKLMNAHSEITDSMIHYASSGSSAPVPPASVADPPQILRLRRLGIHKL